MRRLLSSRIDRLEKSAPEPKQTPKQLSEEEMEQRDAELIRKMNAITYSHWRHHGLSLEQLLALARDDSALAQANPRSTWSPGYVQAEPGVWVDIWPSVGAREFEIRILERDAKIDAETAKLLRENIHDRFFVDGPVTEHAYGAPLMPLPYQIELDAAALKAARLQCPHFDSLPLEKQLQFLEENLLKQRERAAKSRQHAAAVALRAPRSEEASYAEMVARLEEPRPYEHLQITELKEKIAERARGSRPVQTDTSATA